MVREKVGKLGNREIGKLNGSSPISQFPSFLLGIVAIAAAWAYLGGVAENPAWLHIACKVIPVLCLAAWAWRGRRAVALGLLASALGDGFLDAGASWFLPGMLAFLTAHLCYTAAFVAADRRLKPVYAIPFVVWAVMALLAVRANVGAMAAPVTVYVIVICAMMWRSAAQAPGHRLAWLGCAGAVMFGASDTLIALGNWRPGFTASGLAIMLLYWGGQALITAWGRVPEPVTSRPATVPPR